MSKKKSVIKADKKVIVKKSNPKKIAVSKPAVKKPISVKKSVVKTAAKSGVLKKSSATGAKKAPIKDTKVSAGKVSSGKEQKKSKKQSQDKILDTYSFTSGEIPITVNIIQTPREFVPIYEVSIVAISKNTEFVLEKIRDEIIDQVNLGMIDIISMKRENIAEEKFKEAIKNLIDKYFPEVDQKTSEFLTTYLIQRSLGLGSIEILNSDANLEEIAINSASEPVWVYHRKYNWLKTNIVLKSEDQTRHYASMIGRKVGRQITVLEPLLDANLATGDRVNATLNPISVNGNTITLRKFAARPWTITDFLKEGTMSIEIAALIWLSIQYELSALIAGGTASGKTSMLNVCSNFFPPNQRIITIEDTRELRLPSFLHVLPMITRLPNPEGKGEVSMLDLLVNSLRQRPDRILVGEIRRKKEAQVLFEAIHTGHSVYATIHANTAHETTERLTNPPIDVPKTMVQAISLVIVQYRNRRTGKRRTFQVAEVLPGAEVNVIYQYDPKKDTFIRPNKPKLIFKTLEMFTGMSQKRFKKILAEKVKVLKYLIKHDLNTVDGVGRVVALYYTDKDKLMKMISRGQVPEEG